METVDSTQRLRQLVGQWRNQTVALVPTMGNLHEGHLTLVDSARNLADRTVASIFVNPTQFGPGEDFDSYPRTLDEDLAKLADRGCDLVFVPDQIQLYPQGIEAYTQVLVPAVGGGLCDAHRPGHFEGVASVVCRLFNAVQPDCAVFGQKDYQQLLTIRRMVAELLIPVTIHGAPIARESSGLAMSSRNNYLSADQRQQAGEIYQTLCRLEQQLKARAEALPESWPDLRAAAIDRLLGAGLSPEYLELRDANTLSADLQANSLDLVVLAACHLAGTRLIDNRVISVASAGLAD